MTLYLDFYPPIIHPDTGKSTRREFLKLYIHNRPRSVLERKHNKETQALADNIQAKRQLAIQNERFGFLSDEKKSIDFVEYFKELAEKRKSSNHDNWISAYHYLKQFTGGSLTLDLLTENFCADFRDFLLSVKTKRRGNPPLSTNSASSYFNKFKATLRQAYRDNLLTSDLNAKIKSIRSAESEREFLTIEELERLAKVECSLPILKRSALFSSLTGLRFSDLQKLTWSEIRHSKKQGYTIHFRQKKTKGIEVLPISEQAYTLLGKPGEAMEKVFTDLKYSSYNNVYLKEWILNAGIKRKITFHCFRHTFATLQLMLGTDIYTISKMLGHRELKTTQIYAKVVDKLKREAANRIRLNISELKK